VALFKGSGDALPFATIAIGGLTEVDCELKKTLCQRAIQCYWSSLRRRGNDSDKTVLVPGGGIFESVLSHYLLMDSESNGTEEPYYVAAMEVFIDACLVVPRALASNAGNRNREDVIQKAIQMFLDETLASNNVSIYDQLDIKLSTIRTATSLACSLLKSVLSGLIIPVIRLLTTTHAVSRIT